MSKILLYTENYATGGGNKYLADIINSISDKYEVVLISNIGGITDVDFRLIKRRYTYQSIDIYTFAKTFPFLSKIFRKIIFLITLPFYQKKNFKLFSVLINSIQPALVISCSGGYPTALSCLDLVNTCKKVGRKCILTIVSTPRSRSIIDCYYKNIPTSATKVVVNSNVVKNALVDSRGFKDEDFLVIHNSVADYLNVDTWSFDKKKDERLLAYIGRIEKIKGCYVLLDAFKEISKDKNVRLLMIGGGKELGDIQSYAVSIGLGDRVIFTGYVDVNIYAILSLIDIFVFPSLWESFPYSILEAMNAGKIIVSTNVGGIPEAITNKKEGILIPPNNTKELSLNLRDVISHIDSYRYLGINAKKKVDREFRFSTFREDINKLIQNILTT